MKSRQLRKVQFCVAVAIFFVGVLGYTLYSYQNLRGQMLQIVDGKLQVAAYATADLLGAELHAGLRDKNTISPEKDFEIALALTEFVRKIGIAYVYTMVRRDGQVYFVTSSATEQELTENRYQKAYFSIYHEAPQAVNAAFDDAQIRFAEYQDRWGSFRSIFVPLNAADGSQYLVGADIDIDRVNVISRASAAHALLVSMFIALIGFPLIYFLSRSIRREAAIEIAHLHTDVLTGLPNRQKLIEDLKNCEHPNLAVINIDRFREVTNIYGPAVGDAVLSQFANRVLGFSHPQLKNYRVYRLHGDEFAALVDQDIPEPELEQIFRQFFKYLTEAEYFIHDDRKIALKINMGAVTGEQDALTLADMAMRQAKDTNQSVVVYDRKLRLPQAYRHNLQQIDELRSALDEDRMVPYFQPLKNTRTGEIDKYEVLTRMLDADGCVLQQPKEFLPVAYRYRLYRHIIMHVFPRALAEVADTGHTISLNFSVRDIENPSTSMFILNTLKQSGLGHQVQFELLENESMVNRGRMIKFFHDLKALGCRLGVDDLGKEYSNFDRLLKLPIDFVKIDGQLMQQIARNEGAQKLVKKIVSFANDRGLETVAEQCSTKEICDAAEYLGVDYLQGFYIGKPSPCLEPVRTIDFLKEASIQDIH